MPALAIAHASLKHPHAKEAATYLTRIAHAGAHVITTTESREMGPEVREALRPLGYRTLRAGQHLCVFDTSHLRLDPKRQPRELILSDAYDDDGPDWWREFSAASFPLIHRSGQAVDVWAFHAPSGIEWGNRWASRRPGAEGWRRPRVGAAVQGYDRLGARLDRDRRRRPSVSQVVAGDTNLDMRRERWRDYLDHSIDLTSTHRRTNPATHGSRAIDGIWTDLPVRKPLALVSATRPRVIDHRAVWTTLELRKDAA